MILTCNACKGEYDNGSPDGPDYFHVCPEGTPLAVRRNENIVSTHEADRGRVRAPGAGAKETTPAESHARIARELAEFEAHAKK